MTAALNYSCSRGLLGASVPLPLDAVPARSVAVQRRDEAEQAAVRAVSKQVAARFDRVAGAHVFAPDAVVEDAGRRRRFERPDAVLALSSLTSR